MENNAQNWVVLKFGGTSVKSLADWRVISKRIAAVRAEGKRAFIVHSAVATVSDALDRLVTEAVGGGGEDALDAIRRIHLDLADELGLDGETLLADPFEELTRLRAGLAGGAHRPRRHADHRLAGPPGAGLRRSGRKHMKSTCKTHQNT